MHRHSGQVGVNAKDATQPLVLALAALLLSACGENAEAPSTIEAEAIKEEAAGVEVQPGLYAVGDETTEYARTRLNADGTFVDLADGVEVGRGSWTADGPVMCLDPEGDGEEQQERCWTNGPAEEDGSFISTLGDSGQSYRVTPIAE